MCSKSDGGCKVEGIGFGRDSVAPHTHTRTHAHTRAPSHPRTPSLTDPCAPPYLLQPQRQAHKFHWTHAPACHQRARTQTHARTNTRARKYARTRTHSGEQGPQRKLLLIRDIHAQCKIHHKRIAQSMLSLDRDSHSPCTCKRTQARPHNCARTRAHIHLPQKHKPQANNDLPYQKRAYVILSR